MTGKKLKFPGGFNQLLDPLEVT